MKIVCLNKDKSLYPEKKKYIIKYIQMSTYYRSNIL